MMTPPAFRYVCSNTQAQVQKQMGAHRQVPAVGAGDHEAGREVVGLRVNLPDEIPQFHGFVEGIRIDPGRPVDLDPDSPVNGVSI